MYQGILLGIDVQYSRSVSLEEMFFISILMMMYPD